MGVPMRAELSRSNRYWIDRHRYYELKHFCMQYNNWKKRYADINTNMNQSFSDVVVSKTKTLVDPTYKVVEARSTYLNRINLIEQTAMETDSYLSSYILKGVTEGMSYNTLKVRTGIPCSRDVYYDRYRRFFWLLDKARD